MPSLHRECYCTLIIDSVCLFVCGKRQTCGMNWHQTLRNDKERPESVLHGLKSPTLVFAGRYCDISSFSFAADRHFHLSPFHFWLLPRHVTQSAFAKTALTACHTRETCWRWASMLVTRWFATSVQCFVLHRTHLVLQQILKQVSMPSHHTKPCSHGR